MKTPAEMSAKDTASVARKGMSPVLGSSPFLAPVLRSSHSSRLPALAFLLG